jgi:CheY-like chemotaxis protein
MNSTRSSVAWGLLASKRVLIVDDNADSRDLLRLVLEAYDVTVTDAESATDALDELEHSDFDLLISDIGMPVVDGYAFIRAVRRRSRSACMPAVAMTAFVRVEDRARALFEGFDSHITKPCDFAALIPVLVELLACHRQAYS